MKLCEHGHGRGGQGPLAKRHECVAVEEHRRRVVGRREGPRQVGQLLRLHGPMARRRRAPPFGRGSVGWSAALTPGAALILRARHGRARLHRGCLRCGRHHRDRARRLSPPSKEARERRLHARKRRVSAAVRCGGGGGSGSGGGGGGGGGGG
eukprot:scaffold10794_cov66-Phaeocystis_antarctica.AAC.6